MAPRLVVAGIGTEETFAAARELLAAVCVEWLDPLVAAARALLVRKASPMQPVVRRLLGEPPRLGLELVQVGAKRGVQQPDLDGLLCPDRVERAPE